MLPLVTGRLVLRPVSADDAQTTARLVSPDVSRNLSSWPSPLSVDQALERIAASRRALQERDAIDLAITSKADRKLLGWIGLGRTGDDEARLGYWIGVQHRGQGFVKEAVEAMLLPCAAFLGVHRLIAYVLPQNLPSIAILERAGFAFEGAERKFMEVRQTYETCLRFARKMPAGLGRPLYDP